MSFCCERRGLCPHVSGSRTCFRSLSLSSPCPTIPSVFHSKSNSWPTHVVAILQIYRGLQISYQNSQKTKTSQQSKLNLYRLTRVLKFEITILFVIGQYWSHVKERGIWKSTLGRVNIFKMVNLPVIIFKKVAIFGKKDFHFKKQ